MASSLLHINSIEDRTYNEFNSGHWTTYLRTSFRATTGFLITMVDAEVPNALSSFPYTSSCFWYHPTSAQALTCIAIDDTRSFEDGEEFTGYLTSKQTDLTFTCNRHTNHITIHNNTATEITVVRSHRWSVDNRATNSCIDRIGFTQSRLVIPAGGDLLAESALRLMPTNCYYICLKEGQSQSVTPIRLPYAILGRVAADSYGGVSQQPAVSEFPIRINNNLLDMLSFIVLDDEKFEVDFGMSVPITLSLRILPF